MIIIVIPAFNEEEILEANIIKLNNFCKQNLTNWFIVIADNNSQDRTQAIGQKLAFNLKPVEYLFIPTQGKGGAIKDAWQHSASKFSDNNVYCFMDADLATDLKALPKLINAIDKENYDLAIGNRHHRSSKVKRGSTRKIFSFGYNKLAKLLLQTHIDDLPCGFKAINQKVLDKIVPQVSSRDWFFDSELMLRAEHHNLKIKQLPITWVDDQNQASKVNVVNLVIEYVQQLWRVRKIFKQP
ncbi:MAG: hypothetical protein COT81_04345 [Candidatus Buchananbacteria bacterium CG10_big_fil_rev_8_21_14_0_10_42_9]|uniref:Glycosyltransferase 2-like domain-containing protein n=1 Tax=Candidatus Buchananbacteria bacterium CG10_big_fil_rev_8_21_14_0_10_42_9 TaxID=1974526 RepID=A0A2H0W0G8_9BACT|nr:MAG: hypothetical protein COT81_04345 [Candidatus Buchananbacteria bacterium CG10_big_fil_rev_8_21_14_0_10_42_9]